MPRKLRHAKRRIDFTVLTSNQRFELILGDIGGRRPSAFPSAEDREAAWEIHREELLESHQIPGRRIWAWWEFDSPEPRSRDEAQADQLIRMGVVDDVELARINREREAREA